MRIRKALVAATVALMGALGGTFAVAAPASAVTSEDGLIDFDELVLWRDTSFSGPLFDEFFGLSDYRTKNFIGTSTNLNDNVSSLANYDDVFSVNVFSNINCTGAPLTLNTIGGTLWFSSNLGSFGLNDQLSSHCWFF
jgi:hypothetical protein